MGVTRRFMQAPMRAPIFGFLLLIALGTLLLSLPISSASTKQLPFIDALFTATSASCVTGLATLDTGADFSGFGQWVILFLIQVGGLGIMAVSTLFILFVRRSGMLGRATLKDLYTHRGDYDVRHILRSVFFFTVTIEGAGALVLTARFMREYSTLVALKLGIFHSISAFCNAGFSLFSSSLVNYSTDLIVNITICILVITGGLGFLVLAELNSFKWTKRSWNRLSLHTKLTVCTTAILLTLGTLTFFLLERHNAFAHLPTSRQWLAAFFQSVTARTAGFNTVDMSQLRTDSLFATMILMFIGAGAGSTGGGIKVTTIATLFLSGWAALNGRNLPQIFRRTISASSVNKALSLTLVSLVIAIAGSLLLNSTESGVIAQADSNGEFLATSFEAVSALATVGLSTGLTPHLTHAGKTLIILLMFIGRLGPLSIAFAISRQHESTIRYAEENVMIG